MLFNREIHETHGAHGRQVEAVFDLSSTQVAAVAAALGHYRRTRFAAAELGADEALELRALNALAEQIEGLAALGGHAVVRIDAEGACTLAHATMVYLDERDTDSYQSPEERERLAALSDLADPLVDLACELRRAHGDRSPAIA